MKNSLKALFMASMLPVMMLMAAVTLTSCEGTLDDIFGEWSRPGSQPTKEELLSDLSSAFEEGAIVTITYTIDGVEYTSTFKYNKTDDEYIEQSTTSPAGTRTFDEIAKGNLSIITVTGNMHIVVKNNAGLKVIFDATVNTKTLKQVTNIASEGVELKAVRVNDQRAAVVNNETGILKVRVNASGGGSGDIENIQIPYTPGQTYDEMVAEKQANGGQYMQIDKNNQVCVTYNGRSGLLVTDEGGQLKNDDLVVAGGGTLRMKLFPPEIYQELSWDATNHKVVTNNKMVDNFNMVTDAQTFVTWEAGTYVVNQNVTINGNISFNGDVNLILCDGCSLTVNGMIVGKEKSLNIYGQAAGSGKLIQKKYEFGLCNFTDLVIHGGNIEMENNRNLKFSLKMYGGKFTARSSITYPIIDLMRYYNNITIYGGELEAVNDAVDAIVVGSESNPGTLTVYGGKVIAKALNPNNGQAIIGSFVAGEGCSIGFYATNDLSNWGEALLSEVTTSTKHYFKAEVEEATAVGPGTN